MNSNPVLGCADASAFRTTHWSVVLKAGEKDAPGQQEAVAKLYETYKYPLYAYLRRSGHDYHQAQDLTQDFFYRLLEKDFLANVTVEGGKFRSFLLTALKRFAVNQWARSRTLKRGGGRPILSLDAEDPESRYRAEPEHKTSPDVLFERRWATELLNQTMRKLQTEYRQWRKGKLFDELQVFIVGSDRSLPYKKIAAKLEMSEGAVKVAVHRLRKRYGQLLREEIGRTVTSPEQVEEELRHLINALSRAS